MHSALHKRLATLSSLTRLFCQRPDAIKIFISVKQKKLSLLGFGALADLAIAVNTVERNKIPGMLIEAGCAMGGSALLMTDIKNKVRPFAIYDTFEMIPPPSQEDGIDAQHRFEIIQTGNAKGLSGDSYYGYMNDLFHRVQSSFASAGFPVEPNHIRMYKGLIEQTMHIDQPVALAHIDCDWYSPVMVCLEQIVPHLSRGGILVIDDYYQWSGAHKAVDQYFADIKEDFVFLDKSRLYIQKISAS